MSVRAFSLRKWECVRVQAIHSTPWAPLVCGTNHVRTEVRIGERLISLESNRSVILTPTLILNLTMTLTLKPTLALTLRPQYLCVTGSNFNGYVAEDGAEVVVREVSACGNWVHVDCLHVGYGRVRGWLKSRNIHIQLM